MKFFKKKKREAAAPAPPAQRRPVVETAEHIAATCRWISEALAIDDGFCFAPGCPKTLLGTSFAVCALELLGGLDGLDAPRRQSIAEWILGCQRSDSGLFRDPLHGDDVISSLNKFTPLYLEWQESYFALHALDALDAPPRHELRFIEPFRDPQVLRNWLRALRFDDFWFTSNYLMFILFFFLQLEGDQSASAHRVLDYLDERQDPATGFWGTRPGQGSSLFNGMAGAFHVYGFYQYLGRPLAFQAEAVRATIKLQEKTGLFSDPGGGPCEDLDAVDILVKLTPDPNDEKAVRKALEKAIEALRACRQEDGGYRWSSPQPNVKKRTVRYSGLQSLRVENDGADGWSSWFRPLAIALASERLDREVAWKPHYRRYPLLGWHSPDLVKGQRTNVKEQHEMAYWTGVKEKEGTLSNRHYQRFYTRHFDLDEAFYTSKRVLDIGCGPRGSLEWADMAEERVGLDPLANRYLELGASEQKMRYVASGSEKIPFQDGHFDVVCSFNSLDHVEDLDKSIAEIQRVVKPGGLFILLTDVNHDPTPAEPIEFSWDVVDLFDQLELVETRRYEREKAGLYQSIEAAVPYDDGNEKRRYGVLSAKFRKPG